MANEFDVRGVLHGQVSLGAVSQINRRVKTGQDYPHYCNKVVKTKQINITCQKSLVQLLFFLYTNIASDYNHHCEMDIQSPVLLWGHVLTSGISVFNINPHH